MDWQVKGRRRGGQKKLGGGGAAAQATVRTAVEATEAEQLEAMVKDDDRLDER